jgi:DNA repair protein RecO (recombination protein O)
MRLTAEATICGVRSHGETGTLVRLLTAEAGLVGAFVAGGRGRHLRPVLIPGNRVSAEIATRSPQALPYARVELLASRAPFLSEPLAAAAIGWLTTLTAATLPERHPYPTLHAVLEAALDAVCHAPSARGWVPALLGYERLVLRELGYGEGSVDADQAVQIQRQATLIARHLFAERPLAEPRRDVMGARERLADLIARIAG